MADDSGAPVRNDCRREVKDSGSASSKAFIFPNSKSRWPRIPDRVDFVVHHVVTSRAVEIESHTEHDSRGENDRDARSGNGKRESAGNKYNYAQRYEQPRDLNWCVGREPVLPSRTWVRRQIGA